VFATLVELLEISAYRRLVIGAVLFALGQWMERLAIGWFVFDTTGSVFLTALAWSVRTMPNLILGPVGGAIADRYARSRVLALNSAFRVGVVLCMAAVALFWEGAVVPLLLLVALSGVTMSMQLASLQSLAAALAGTEKMGSAVSLVSFAQRSVGALGVLVSGFLIVMVGAAETLMLAAVPLVIAAVVFWRVPSRPSSLGERRLLSDVADGLRVIYQVPIVGQLLGLMVFAEILGFSFNALMPVIAKDMLQQGAEGLGILMSGASIGSLVGVGLLTHPALHARRGALLLAVVCAFGILVVFLAQSREFLLSLVVVTGIGGVAAMIDALEWTLLQASVRDNLRGRVLGVWNMAIGMGWLGPLVIGAAADVIGVANALSISGLMLFVVGAAAFASRGLRTA
jgi:MFS family permease